MCSYITWTRALSIITSNGVSLRNRFRRDGRGTTERAVFILSNLLCESGGVWERSVGEHPRYYKPPAAFRNFLRSSPRILSTVAATTNTRVNNSSPPPPGGGARHFADFPPARAEASRTSRKNRPRQRLGVSLGNIANCFPSLLRGATSRNTTQASRIKSVSVVLRWKGSLSDVWDFQTNTRDGSKSKGLSFYFCFI